MFGTLKHSVGGSLNSGTGGMRGLFGTGGKHKEDFMSEKAHQMNETGQLKPLVKRETAARRMARQEKKEYRRHISLEHAKTRGMVQIALSVLRRGFWGRLKWLIRGR
jgi:hypothetical protein